jgi:hypothetical protein
MLGTLGGAAGGLGMARSFGLLGGGNPFMSGWGASSTTPTGESWINRLGSNSWNPLSDYNTGRNGWGSYGE